VTEKSALAERIKTKSFELGWFQDPDSHSMATIKQGVLSTDQSVSTEDSVDTLQQYHYHCCYYRDAYTNKGILRGGKENKTAETGKDWTAACFVATKAVEVLERWASHS